MAISTTDVSIRPASYADIPLLSQLVNGLSHYYLSDDSKNIPNWLQETLTETAFLARLDDKVYQHFVAEIEGKIVGFIAIKQPNHLYHLFVDENYHGYAIGKKLWQYAVKQLDLDNQTIILRASLFAVPFYQKLGFVATDNVMEKDGLNFLPMQKSKIIGN